MNALLDLDDILEHLKYNKELSDLPPPSLEQREEFIKWLDHIQTVCMNVFYAAAPQGAQELELWKNKNFNFVLVGQTDKRNKELPRGMYCIELHPAFDVSYRNPIALAFAHLTKAPEHIIFVPRILGVVLPEPTAHEIFAAKMFFRKLVNDNKENKDLCEWASKLT